MGGVMNSVTVVIGGIAITMMSVGVTGCIVVVMVDWALMAIIMMTADIFVTGRQRTSQGIRKVRVVVGVLGAILKGDVALARKHDRQPHAKRSNHSP